MTVKLPTTTPDEPVEKAPGNKSENKFDPFHPEMPNIPGLSSAPRQPASGSKSGAGIGTGSDPARGAGSAPNSDSSGSGAEAIDSQRLMLFGGIGAAVLLIAVVSFFWAKSKARGTITSSADTDIAEQVTPAPAVSAPIPAPHAGPTVAGTVEELSKPWSSKKFTFVNPTTLENINAMVIRLPNGVLWGFSLKGPFGRCDLEFVTDLGKIATQYRYDATHPMVVNPCDSTVYDPLKVGPLGGNTWARGEIVQGSSLRPPISIDMKVRGKVIVADSIE